jgi:hypothetical protein
MPRRPKKPKKSQKNSDDNSPLLQTIQGWRAIAAEIGISEPALQKALRRIDEPLIEHGATQIEVKRLDLLLWAVKHSVGCFCTNAPSIRARHRRLGYVERIQLAKHSPESASLFGDVDLEDTEESQSEDDLVNLKQDSARIRRVLNRFQKIMASINPKALEDAENARVFGQYTEIFSRVMDRLLNFEKKAMELQKQRGELIRQDEATEFMTTLADNYQSQVEDLVLELVDHFIAEELKAHECNKINNTRLRDEAEGIQKRFSQRIADRLRMSVGALEQSRDE